MFRKMFYSAPMFFFDVSKTGAEGGAQAAPETDPKPTSQPVSETVPQAQKPPTPTGEDKPGQGEERTLELNQHQLNERLDRARGVARIEFLESLGFSTEEALKEFLQKGNEAISKTMTEDERKVAELKQAQDEAQAAKETAKQAQKEALTAKMERKAVGLMAGRFHDPDAVLKLVDLSSVDLESGSFDGLDKAIDAVAAQYPWTVLQEGQQPPKTRQQTPKVNPVNPSGDPDSGKKSDGQRRAQYFGGQQSTGFFEPKEDGVATPVSTPGKLNKS